MALQAKSAARLQSALEPASNFAASEGCLRPGKRSFDVNLPLCKAFRRMRQILSQTTKRVLGA